MTSLTEHWKPDQHLSLRVTNMHRFTRCRRQWILDHLGYRGQNSEAALRGTLVHVGLEAWYSGAGNTTGAVLAEAVEIAGPVDGWEKWQSDALRYATVMLTGYMERLEQGIDIGRKVIAVEREVTHYFPDLNTTLKGHVDLIWETEFGLTVTDHKTTTRTYETIPDNQQLMAYSYLLYLEDGEWPDAAEHNVLRTVLRTRASKSEPYYRSQVLINEFQRQSSEMYIIETIKDMRHALDRGDRAMYPSVAETGHCGWCSFKDVCPQLSDGSDYQHTLDTQYIREQGK